MKVFYNCGVYRPRTCVLVIKTVECVTLRELCSRDLTALLVKTDEASGRLVLVSAYLTYDLDETPPGKNAKHFVEW